MIPKVDEVVVPRCEADRVQVHLIQVSYDDREPVDERVARVAQLVSAQRGADMVVLPELWAHGAFACDRWSERAESLAGPTVSAIAEAARAAGVVVHAGSVIEKGDGGAEGRNLWNTSLLLNPSGEQLAVYRKIHRFGFGSGEPKLLERGDEVVAVSVEFALRRWRVGLATCYDLRFPELFRRLADQESELVLVPAAWPAARAEHWELLGRARAIENQAFVLQCNTAGTHSGTTMGGRSQVVSPTGEVLARAGEGEEVLKAELDSGLLRAYRESFPVLQDRRL